MEMFNCRLVRPTKPHFSDKFYLLLKTDSIVLYLGKTSNETLRFVEATDKICGFRVESYLKENNMLQN